MSESSRRGLFFAPAIFMLLSACSSSSIPPDMMEQVDSNLSFAEAQNAPAQFQGRIFLLGGTVEERKDLRDTMRLRVRAYPLDNQHRPRVSSQSEGSFQALSRPADDPARTLPGKWVTMVGRLNGTEPIMSGARRDSIPSFEVLYLYVWDPPFPRNKGPLADPHVVQVPAGGMDSIGFGPVSHLGPITYR